MDRYEPFDLKITKLTGTKWQRENVADLLKQLIEEQGKPRYSVENRIIIALDGSIDSSVQFLRLNRDILLEVLLNIAYNPYVFTCRLARYWFGFALVRNYHRGHKYYEHPIGYGMREPGKAEFENELVRVAAQKSGGLIKYNPDTKEHGHDGDLRIDRAKIKDADTQIEPAPVFENLKLHVCDYGTPPVPDWPNCLPCPLYKNGHCLSRGAAIYRAIHSKEVEMPTDKGHCKHGEFILTEGCPQCIAERQATEYTQRQAIRDKEELESAEAGNAEWLKFAREGQQQEMAPSLPHQPYRLQDGSIVPGVTTVLKVLDKGEQLQDWIWECGKQGLDYREVRDAAGRVGTLTHDLIACHLKGERPLSGVYPPEEVDKVTICFEKYLAWEKKNPLSPVMIETPLVSEEFKYGGTPDLLAEINSEFVLIDFKTGGGIYDSYLHQVAAYRKLLEEQGWPVARAWILEISPEDGEYELAMQLDFDRDWQIFQHALAIYRLQEE